MKIFQKAGLIAMALAAMITMNGCTQLNQDTADWVCGALSEKYGQEFVPVKIGDRLNTDHAKLYLHPKDNEDLLFTAKGNRKTRQVEDDFRTRQVCRTLEQALTEAFSRQGLKGSARIYVVTRNPLTPENREYTPESFQKTYEFQRYTAYLAVENTGLTGAALSAALEELSREQGVDLACAVYVYGQEAYEACVHQMAETPEISTTDLEQRQPLASLTVLADQGICLPDADTLAAALKEG